MPVGHLLPYFRSIAFQSAPINVLDIFPESPRRSQRFRQILQAHIRWRWIQPCLNIQAVLDEQFEIGSAQDSKVGLASGGLERWFARAIKAAGTPTRFGRRTISGFTAAATDEMAQARAQARV